MLNYVDPAPYENKRVDNILIYSTYKLIFARMIIQHLFFPTCMHIIFHSNSYFLLEENNIKVIPNTWIEFSHVKGEQRKLDFVIVQHVTL